MFKLVLENAEELETNCKIIKKATEFQQNMNHELPDVQTGFRKGRGTRDLIADSH